MKDAPKISIWKDRNSQKHVLSGRGKVADDGDVKLNIPKNKLPLATIVGWNICATIDGDVYNGTIIMFSKRRDYCVIWFEQ